MGVKRKTQKSFLVVLGVFVSLCLCGKGLFVFCFLISLCSLRPLRFILLLVLRSVQRRFIMLDTWCSRWRRWPCHVSCSARSWSESTGYGWCACRFFAGVHFESDTMPGERSGWSRLRSYGKCRGMDVLRFRGTDHARVCLRGWPLRSSAGAC